MTLYVKMAILWNLNLIKNVEDIVVLLTRKLVISVSVSIMVFMNKECFLISNSHLIRQSNSGYRCTVVPLYRCTVVPLYRCTEVPLYRCTVVPLYRCTVVNHALQCLHGGSLEITHTVPLKKLSLFLYQTERYCCFVTSLIVLIQK